MAYNNLKDITAILRMRSLTSTEKLVCVALLSFRNTGSGQCNPPIDSDMTESIVSRTGLSDRGIQKTLKSLVQKDVVRIYKLKNFASDYQVIPQVETSETVTGTPNHVHPRDHKKSLPAPRTTFAPNEVRPERRSLQGEPGSPRGERRSLSPRTTFTQTNKEQIRTNKEQESNSPSPQKNEAELPLELDAIDPKTKQIACPCEEIVDLYHELLPELKRVNKALLSDARRKPVRDRWGFLCRNQGVTSKDEGLDQIRRYFNVVRRQPFLLGQNDRGWKADFDWLFKQSNFVKVLELKYDRKKK